VKPAPIDDIAEVAARSSLLATLEAHYTDGGLGSIVAGVLARDGTCATRLVRYAVDSTPRGVTGSGEYLLRLHGLDGRSVATSILEGIDLARS
jgi:transketolase C-terminal domain/subunit